MPPATRWSGATLERALEAGSAQLGALDRVVRNSPRQLVLHGDGTAGWALHSPEIPSAPIRKGATTWAYVGQNRVPTRRALTERYLASEGGPPESDFDGLRESVRVDALGRVGRAQRIDVDAAQNRAGASPSSDIHAARPTEPKQTTWRRPRWVALSCSAPLGASTYASDEFVWGVEGRVNILGPPWTDRQRRVVAIFGRNPTDVRAGTWPDGNFICSGAVVGDANGAVLTAAHCVVDPQNAVALNPVQLRVCTYGNAFVDPAAPSEAVCTDVTSVHVNSKFLNNGFPPKWDLAVLHTQDDLNALVGSFNLSNESPGQVEGVDLHNNAYPAFLPPSGAVCEPLNVSLSGVIDPDLNGVAQYRQRGRAVSASPNLVKTRFDNSSGMSGSPIFKCQGDDCNAGETGAIVAVMGSMQDDPAIPLLDRVLDSSSVPGHRTWITNRL